MTLLRVMIFNGSFQFYQQERTLCSFSF